MEGMDIDDPPPLPDNVLVEVRRFILGCSSKPVETSGVASLYSTEQSRLALHLLKTLPCARSAVLEYLCNVFNEAVNCHLGQTINRGNQATRIPGYIDALNSIVGQAQEVLLDFVSKNPESWAPIVSAWAIELLGQISSEYSHQCMRANASLQDMFQMYTSCPASSALLDITSRCVSTLIASCPDLCVNELLNTAVRHAPAFDWVVAHIGSCFPKTIIARVISVGLKDFCVFHCVSGGEGVDVNGGEAEMFSAKMNSVVGILNYLTSRGHKLDIRCAIHAQFQESLSPLEDDAVVDSSASASSSAAVDSATMQYATLPYLLHLASLSPVLLKIVAADIVASFSKPVVLRQLTEHLERWLKASSAKITGNGALAEERLLSLAVSLILRIDDSGSALDVLKLLMHTADPESFAKKSDGDEDDDDDDDDIPYIPDVAKNAAFTMLDHLILQLQQRVYASFKDRADVPFLIAIKNEWRSICGMLIPNGPSASSDRRRRRRRRVCSRLETSLVRLLTFISLQSETLSTTVLSTIILKSSSAKEVSAFFPILSGVQSLTPPMLVNVPHAVFEAMSCRNDEYVAYRALTNVRHLLEIEKYSVTISSPSEASSGLMPNSSLKSCLQKADSLTTVARILSSFSSCRVQRVGIQLLLHLGLSNSSMSSSTLLATGIAVNFFKLVAESSSVPLISDSAEDAVKKRLEYQKTLTLSCQFLAKLCQRSPSIRTVILRALLEGCLSPEYSNLFSTTSNLQSVLTISDSSQIGGHSLSVSSDSVAPTASLRSDNYALPSQRGRTLPSGVIGNGLRHKPANASGSQKGFLSKSWENANDDAASKDISAYTRSSNKAALLDAFYRCCSNQEVEDMNSSSHSTESATNSSSKPATSKKLPRLTPSKSATQNLGQLLSELVSPEVLQVGCLGSAWPDEETVRHTVERDLVIKKRLQNHDVILDLIDLVAKGGATSLVPCLPIVRAWMASLIIFWDSNRDSNPGAASNTWYYSASLRLINTMAIGNLLPHPLSHSDELFQFAAPFERYLLLVNIWRFMKEFPLPVDLDEEKLETRLREVDPKFIEVMRSVTNANIARASHLFGFLFPAATKKRTSVIPV